MTPPVPCRHSATVYDEVQGALWCARCGDWVLDEDRASHEPEGKPS